jgi:hypothetical protein
MEGNIRMRFKRAVFIGTLSLLFCMLLCIVSGIAGYPDQTDHPFLLPDQNDEASDMIVDAFLMQSQGYFDNLSEAQQKISSILPLLDPNYPRMHSERTADEEKEGLLNEGVLKRDDQSAEEFIMVYVYFDENAQINVLDSFLTDIDGHIHNDMYNLVCGWIPLNKVVELASRKEVTSIEIVMPPVFFSGSVLTEGNKIYDSDQLQAEYGSQPAVEIEGISSRSEDNRLETINESFIDREINVPVGKITMPPFIEQGYIQEESIEKRMDFYPIFPTYSIIESSNGITPAPLMTTSPFNIF